MRILIDLQGAQTGSRFRGIGRSATALTRAIIRNRGDHEVLILLNGLFPDTIDPIRKEFAAILPADHIVVFAAPSPVAGLIADNAWRIEAAELIREWVINALAPDALLITSLFEGAGDDSVTSIRPMGTTMATAVVLHDLIPFLDPDRYLGDPAANKWYYSKITSLRNADLLLAVSESSRREAVEALGFDASRVVAVHSAADERFTRANLSVKERETFLERMGIRRRFVLHASKIEPRKNFEGLIRAFGRLTAPVRETHQLVLVGDHGSEEQGALRRLASDAGLAADDIVFPGHVSDSELIALYSLCSLFVFPSFHEGFGLPALEAMCCGAAVIGSNKTSIPEVIGREDALFDPHSDQSMTALIERALTDAEFHESLRAHALQWSKRFSWNETARLALKALEEVAPSRASARARQDISILLAQIGAIRVGASPDRKSLVAVADCIAKNERAMSQWARVRGDDKNGVEDEIDSAQNRLDIEERRYDATFVKQLYHIFHNREPDADGFKSHLGALRSGREPHELVEEFLKSEEFSLRMMPHRRRPVAAMPSATKSSGQLASPPEVEVIRREIWLREDRPRILLLKLDHIGDFVITLGAFRLIRDTWPKAHITLVCGPWNQALAKQSGLFDTILCCSFYPDTSAQYDKEAVMAKGLEKYRALLLGAYDLAVDLRYFDDNRMLLSHTDAKYRAGYVASGIRLDLALPISPEPELTVHNGARAMALAAAVAWTFGAPAGGVRQRLLNGRAPRRAFGKGVVIGIAPGTGNPVKSWGRERFAELARILQARGNYQIVLIGGNAERVDTQFIAESLPKAHVADLAGALSIADLPPVIAGLDLFIGNDTGTTHMAAMMGVPTVCIYSGQTHIESWGPVGANVVILRRSVGCSPCNLADIGHCAWNHQCMDIPPTRVAAEALGLHETADFASRDCRRWDLHAYRFSALGKEGQKLARKINLARN